MIKSFIVIIFTYFFNVLFTAKQSPAKRTFSSDSVRTSCDELRGNAEAKNLKAHPPKCSAFSQILPFDLTKAQALPLNLLS
ncbi:hypothetical protein DXG11_00690 [Campylobacter upsaliensis]|nr:hypothetical protein [Campylobacter upsaliensis]